LHRWRASYIQFNGLLLIDGRRPRACREQEASCIEDLREGSYGRNPEHALSVRPERLNAAHSAGKATLLHGDRTTQNVGCLGECGPKQADGATS
jgi:hypothetical protein